MLKRSLEHPEVQATRYLAHGGGVAHMILDRRHLKSMMFLAHALLPAGQRLEGHCDPMEEIYIVQSGQGLMAVDEIYREVKAGDAVHIPVGSFHEMINTGPEDMSILVVAGLIPE